MLAPQHVAAKVQAGLILLGFVTTAPSVASSTPVTLRFESVIDNVVIQGSPDLIPPLQLGDRVFGQFTFDPIDAEYAELGGETTANVPYALTLTLNNEIVSAASYSIQSRDEYPAIDSEFSHESIFVNNLQWSEYIGLSQLGFRPGRFSLRFTMSPGGLGDDILHGPDIPSNPDVWNSFASRRFSLSFLDGNDRGWISLSGSIDIIAIPETGTLTLGLLLASFAIACHFRKTGKLRYVQIRFIDAHKKDVTSPIGF